MNTAEETYIYSIDFFSGQFPDRTFVGPTQTARSMFLDITPTDRALELRWNVNVPWQNDHYTIYRLNTETFSYDSVGFSLQPAYDDTGLENGLEYTYFIKVSETIQPPEL